MTWRRPAQAFARDRKGSAAAEMALVMPLLLALGFGCFELGNYFWNNHIVGKAVRDGARYAARQPFVKLGCGPGVTDAATETNIKNVTRTGTIAGGNARVRGWDNSEVTVTVECQPTPSRDLCRRHLRGTERRRAHGHRDSRGTLSDLLRPAWLQQRQSDRQRPLPGGGDGHMILARLLKDRAAASAAEFALVLPLLLFFLFGIVDGGRLMWMSNRAEKAAQMGARYAAVTDMIPSTLASRDFALNGGVPGGDPVPRRHCSVQRSATTRLARIVGVTIAPHSTRWSIASDCSSRKRRRRMS